MTGKEHEHQHEFSIEQTILVLSALERDQLTGGKKQCLPRRHLKGFEVIILWSLRVYLLFMMGVVVYQIWSGAR
jgi:hypothetical protein